MVGRKLLVMVDGDNYATPQSRFDVSFQDWYHHIAHPRDFASCRRRRFLNEVNNPARTLRGEELQFQQLGPTSRVRFAIWSSIQSTLASLT